MEAIAIVTLLAALQVFWFAFMVGSARVKTGVKAPAWMDGRSFVEFMKNPASDESRRKSLLYEYYWEPAFPQTPTTFCLRGERFKLIQYHGLWDTDELYDLQSDPSETENLIRSPEHQQQVSQMRQQLYQRLKEANGLAIPLGYKRNDGSNQRKREGSKRAEFPSYLLRDGS